MLALQNHARTAMTANNRSNSTRGSAVALTQLPAGFCSQSDSIEGLPSPQTAPDHPISRDRGKNNTSFIFTYYSLV
jgi:hypothetical protein